MSIIPTSLNTNLYAPSIIEIDSLGIGLSSHSNYERLDMTSDEYLLIGERANQSYNNNTLDTKYNFIVNSDGCAINTTRRMFSDIHSNAYQNAGLYVNGDTVVEGNIICKGLSLHNVLLSGEINQSVLNELVQKVNQQDLLFYRGFTDPMQNFINQEILVNNIYTPNYVTIGSYIDTFSNSYALNICESANNSINNIQICIQNDINNETEPSKGRIGLIGGSPYSPFVISTTDGMPLEFHISKTTKQMDDLYADGSGFPNYFLPSNLLPNMTIDARGNIGINTTSTDKLIFNQYYNNNNYNIIRSTKEEYSKLKVDGSAFIENIITYDYYSKSNMHLDDIYVRGEGLTIKANQIKSGDFNKGEFKFHSNLYIGSSNDNYTLNVNSILNVNGDLNVSDYAVLNHLNVDGITDFNKETRFADDVFMLNDLFLSNCLHINGDIFYENGKRLNVVDLQPIFINIPKIDIEVKNINQYFPEIYNKELSSNISDYIVTYINQNGTMNLLNDVKLYITSYTSNYLLYNSSNLIYTSIYHNINSNYIADINNYINNYLKTSHISSNSTYYIQNYIDSKNTIYNTNIIPHILSNINQNTYNYINDYVPIHYNSNQLLINMNSNIQYNINYFGTNYIHSGSNIIYNISNHIILNSPITSNYLDNIINNIYTCNSIYYPEIVTYFNGVTSNISSNVIDYIDTQNINNLISEYNNYIIYDKPFSFVLTSYLYNNYQSNIIINPNYLTQYSTNKINSNIINYGRSNIIKDINNYIYDITNISSNTIFNIFNHIYNSNYLPNSNISQYIPNNINNNISNIVLNDITTYGTTNLVNNINDYVITLLKLTSNTPNDVIYNTYNNTLTYSNIYPIFPSQISSNVSDYVLSTIDNIDKITITSNIDDFNKITTLLSPSVVNDILLNTIFDIYVTNNKPTINDADLGLLHGLNLTNSNIVYFANNHTLNISGSNLAVPGRMGVGILDNDCYDQQMTINKREEYRFELMLQDFSKNTPDSSKVYIGHTKGLKDQYSGLISHLEDESFMIFTQRNVGWHNIYFFPGKDINRTYGIKNQIPTLAIMQNDKVGINTNRPEKELDVIGNIICNDLYVRKNNNITYKTIQFVYNNYNNTNNTSSYNNLNNYIYIYDPSVKNICVNFYDTTNVNLKGLNVSGGINSLDGYYDNNIKISNLKHHETKSVHINENVSIGWKGETNNKVPLQVRNLSIDKNNYSVIRLYRGQRGGGFYNEAIYTGIDICEYDPALPIHDRDNYKWFMYKYCIDNPELHRVGPLQFGYTDGTYEPKDFAMSIYHNHNGSYHIDVNNPKVDFNYKTKTAMSIHGDLDVYGNINLIDTSNLGYNYRINGVAVSSNIAASILNNSFVNSSYDDYILSKDDIALNGQKIVILPNKVTALGYVDNWFLQYVQRLDTDTNDNTPLVVYQKNAGKAICKFEAVDSETPSTASIEVGVFYTKKNYNGENKNMAEFKVSGYNDTTILQINSFSTFNQSLRPFITFYNNGMKNYTNIGSYACYDVLTGVPIVENVCMHINDSANYLLQLTNHTKTPIINLHRVNGSLNNYWLLNGPDDNNNFGIQYAESLPSSYLPDNIKEIVTITNNGLLGINNTKPYETLDISSAYNTPASKLTNKYIHNELFQKTSRITTVNSNLKIIDIVPLTYTSNNNTFYSGFDYTIDTSNLPRKDNSNVTIFNYFLINSVINISNTIPATTYHEVNALIYQSNLYFNSSNIILTSITSNIDIVSSNYDINFIKDITILPNLRNYDDFNLFIPQGYIFNKSIYNISNIYHIDIAPDIRLSYNYSNLYTLPNILAPDYDDIINTHSVTYNIINESNIYVYNTINTILPISSDLSHNKYNINIDKNTYLLGSYSNHITTSNIIWYNDYATFNLGIATYRTKDYTINSTIKAPNLLTKPYIHTLPPPVISDSNIHIVSTVDFLNPMPIAPSVIDFTYYILRKTLNTRNIIDEFEIYDIKQETNITFEDGYYLYDFMDYIKDIYLNIECIQYLPHITLQNYIQFDDLTTYPIDKVHKIFSYEGNFDLYLDKEGNSDKLLSITETGNTDIKGNLTTNDIIIKGHIYDSLGNDLVQQINSDVYTINTINYQVTSSNIVFNPIGSYGILINGQERNYTNNIFQINSGKKDNDGNFITLHSYTNSSYIHFTSHTQVSYNEYDDNMYRLGMFNDTFGIWKYNLKDAGTLSGGYVDGKPSSMNDYTSVFNMKWNKDINKFDFDINGTLNLDETSNSYIRIGNTKIQNNTIKQIDNSNNIISFINYLNDEVMTITDTNVGIANTTPDIDYKLHISGSVKIDEDIRCDGNVISASDIRYKNDINRIENALDKLCSLTGITYNSKLQNKRQSGLIAQEVEKVLPEVISIDSDGYLSVAYGNMMGLIVESIKDLKTEINTIKSHLNIN